MVELLPFLQFSVEVGPLVDLGARNGIRHRMVPITGGTVSGTHAGTILPGGADWQEMSADGTLDIAARYVLSLEQGFVEVDSRGIRHAQPDVLARLDAGALVDKSEYYFRTAIRFRTSAQPLAYLNTLLAVSVGERHAHAVRLDIYRLS